MFGLLRKQVQVGVELREGSELNAIVRVASFAGEKLDLASQELRSGLLASEAQGAHIVADHIVVTHATSASVKQPEVVVVSFASPIAWGESAQVDVVVALIVPASADAQVLCAKLQADVAANQAALTATASAGALEKARRQLL